MTSCEVVLGRFQGLFQRNDPTAAIQITITDNRERVRNEWLWCWIFAGETHALLPSVRLFLCVDNLFRSVGLLLWMSRIQISLMVKKNSDMNSGALQILENTHMYFLFFMREMQVGMLSQCCPLFLLAAFFHCPGSSLVERSGCLTRTKLQEGIF